MNTAMSLRLRLARLALLFVAAVLWSPLAVAQAEPSAAEAGKIEADGSLEQLTGRNLSQIDVVFEPPLWAQPTLLSSVRVGQTFTPEVARRALSELGDTGRFGELQAEAEPLGDGVRLRLRVVARRVLTAVRVSGSNEAEELLRSAGIQPGAEVTARSLPQIGDRLTKELGRMGYTQARVRMNSTDTDDPMQILLGVDVMLGEPLRVTKRHFAAWPDPNAPGLSRLLGEYEISEGRRADLEAIENADRRLEERLRGAGYHNARIEHSLKRVAGGSELAIRVYAGSRVVPRIEGNRRFDQKQLLEALSLEESTDRAPSALALRLREFYIARERCSHQSSCVYQPGRSFAHACSGGRVNHGVWVSPGVQQPLNQRQWITRFHPGEVGGRLHIAAVHSPEQWSKALCISLIHIGMTVDQELRDIVAAVKESERQSVLAITGLRVDLRACFY